MEKHWVEKLFPPFYTYTLDTATTPSDNSSSAGAADSGIGRDPKREQEIYDRVRIELNRTAKERQQKCIQVGEPLAEHLPQKSPSDGSTSRRKSRKKTPSKKEDDECIWTAKELAILRQASEEAKQDNACLQAKLSVATKQNEKLGRKYKRQSATLAAKEAKLLEGKQETERLSLRCHHLETELKHFRMIVKLLEEDVSNLQESKQKLQKQLKTLQRELSAEELAHAKVDEELKQIKKTNALESIVREDGIRLDYEKQIKSLYEELEEARAELEKEKNENISVRKALDHLRIHFASLPSEDSDLKRPQSDELGQLYLY